MATRNGTPIPDLLRGKETLESDLEQVLHGISIEKAGWCRSDDMSILVPIYAKRPDHPPDFYLLKLEFSCYPEWPPSAQFVNPLTLKYVSGVDMKWLPRSEGCLEIAFHDNYSGSGKQLICCSATLEFYEFRHDVKDEHIWRHPNQNFFSTITAVNLGLRQPYYKGPQTGRE